MATSSVYDDNVLGPMSLLLSQLPPAERPSLLQSLIASLRPDDLAGLDLVTSLVQQSGDQHALERLLTYLEQLIDSESAQHAVVVSLKYPRLGERLCTVAMDNVCTARSTENVNSPHDGPLLASLRFLRSTISYFSIVDPVKNTLEACLAIVNVDDSSICLSAKDVLFVVLSTKNERIRNDVVLASSSGIWLSIGKLTSTVSRPSHTLLGYSLWLRWILSVPAGHLERAITDQYWDLLLQGLRHGDAEQRKVCLNIVKLSTSNDSTAVSQDNHAQHDRYCIVFETIVLGRYINQIQECEDDLNALVSDNRLEPRWLYVLLASALDRSMQESNRKFIGNWVMRSKLNANPELYDFLENDFFPWAAQGQLYVSTIRVRRGELRCLHGDRLVDFVQRLLQDTAKATRSSEIVVEYVLSKRHSMFTYATVYLLAGLGDSIPHDQQAQLTGLSKLPEVARDFIQSRVSRNSFVHFERKQPSRRETMEQAAIEACSYDHLDSGMVDVVWKDLEFLEYPKRLLLRVPNLILQHDILQQASQDPALATSLMEKFRTLQDVAETKPYLFPPLILAIRAAILTDASVFNMLDVVDFIVRIAEHPPEPTIDQMLQEAIVPLTAFTYEHYFGARLSYGFATYIDLVSRLHKHQHTIKAIFDRLFGPWKNQKLPPPIVSAWKTTLQLQVLLLCVEQYGPASDVELQSLLNDLFHVLAIEPLPRYRYLLEWMIVRIFTKHNLYDNLLTRLATKDHHSNPKHLASLMKIGVVLACSTDAEQDFTLKLATAFVPLAASSKVVIRHQAQWQVPLLMDHARAQGWTTITGNCAFVALDEYIKSLSRFHEPPLERLVGRFDRSRDHTLSNLVEGRWFDLDHGETPLATWTDLVKLYETNELQDMPECCMPLGPAIERPSAEHEVEADITDVKARVVSKQSAEVTALQTKGTAYLARTLSDPIDDQARPSKLIVVGSLVDNPYNLGGLSRVSEIFGVSALCLQSQNVISNKDFTSVSVSSHLHFPIVQLSASGVPEYLAGKKEEGFTIVGIEQTDRSVILGSEEAKLPEKVVLVVGSEKEGIPAVVLTECDVLVEIPQQGVTRSLNVQTAVSIVLYEHARQHRKAR